MKKKGGMLTILKPAVTKSLGKYTLNHLKSKKKILKKKKKFDVIVYKRCLPPPTIVFKYNKLL